MPKPSPSLRALFAFTVSAAFINSPAPAAELGHLTVSPPSGFEQLTSARAVVLDIYFGGKKLGEARAAIEPGFVTFDDPPSVARLIPDLVLFPELTEGLTGPLPSNVSLACDLARQEGCGTLRPDRVAVILDEEQFRAEIIVHPSLLARPDPSAASYLAAPDGEPSLVSLFGGTFSGSSRGGTSWHFQNRSIASVGNYRLRSDSSLEERAGVTFDNLTLETDRRDWRLTGGLFWAPGTELIGRRRIAGVGAATQLDTRQNKTELEGVPLEIHLQQTAKVDVLVDGRIASSRIYPPGNRLIDTTSLPNGSYEVALRVQEDGRPAREELRFFTKGSSMAPLGRPLYSAFLGLLPSSRRGVSLAGNTLFYQASAAYRMTASLGVDAAILGTQKKAILDAGAIYHSAFAQFRLGALVSTSGDHGIALRAATVGSARLSASIDLRRISSRDGRPLLPISTSRGSFSEDARLGFADRGSFTQALSIISYRMEQATFRLTGLYRKNAEDAANYSVGTSIDVPVVRSSRWDVTVLTDARKTDRDFSVFVGFRFLANRGKVSASASGGLIRRTAGGTRATQLVGEAQAAWHGQLNDQSQLSADLAIGQNIDGAYSRGSAHMRSHSFNARADILRQFDQRDTTQFAMSLDTGITVSKGGITVAARDMNDTGVVVSIAGGGAGEQFDVLVDEVIRGTLEAGGRRVFFLQPYRTYDIRIRARGSISGLDTSARNITLYPGNVANLDWAVTPLVIVFGRAVAADGTPLADASISGSHGVSRTDHAGFFQVETVQADDLTLTRKTGEACNMVVAAAQADSGFVSAGDLICR